jgi:hypothetical protein
MAKCGHVKARDISPDADDVLGEAEPGSRQD